MDGLWIAKFAAGAAHGSGIVVFRPGEVLGGDTAHIYKGEWEEDGPSLSARVRVEPLRGEGEDEQVSRERPFMLTLAGTCSERAAMLAGHPDENPDLTISVELKRA